MAVTPVGQIRYEVRLAELLTRDDSGRFGACSLVFLPDGSTTVTTPPLDQSALHGFLRKLRDTGMTLLSIRAVEGEPSMKQDRQKPRVLGFAFLFQALSSLANGIPFARAGILSGLDTAMSLIFLGAAFSFGAIPLSYLLFKSRIVPRPIGAWGLLSAVFCLAGTVLAIFGRQPPLVFRLSYLPFEFFIAIWIIVRGVNQGEAR